MLLEDHKYLVLHIFLQLIVILQMLLLCFNLISIDFFFFSLVKMCMLCRGRQTKKLENSFGINVRVNGGQGVWIKEKTSIYSGGRS